MARRRANRTPPTPAHRKRLMVIGAALVFFACFVVMYEAIVWESSNPLAIAVVALVLFLVFILPVINSVRHARRRKNLGTSR
jgi:cell division protein FtsW (lipid II flippase)